MARDADANRKDQRPIDRAQHVIGRHELVEAKFIEKALLHHEPIAYHRRIPLPPQLKRITAKARSRALFQRNLPEADAEAVKDKLVAWMPESPVWMPDLPLWAEGWFGLRYRKS